jgi:hypothetical protein
MSLEQYTESVEGYFQFNRPKWLKYSIDYSSVRRTNQKLYDEYAEEFYVEQSKAGAPVYGVRGGVNAPYKKILYNLTPAFNVDRYPANPTVSQFMYNGKEFRVGGSPFERFKRFIDYVKREQEQEAKGDKLLVASIAYAQENDIDIVCAPSNKVIGVVDEYAKTKFIAKKYPNGTFLDVNDNLCECTSWVVGDRRCQCGNRRIYLEIEGDLLSGYYAYPQAY